MSNLIVFHNPDAGHGKWTRKRVERLLRNGGYEVEIHSMKKNWRRALDAEPDAFVAVGGDGTVHKVLRAVEARGLPLAILPTGTANNVAHALGYTIEDDLAQRVASWQALEQQLFLGQVEKRGSRRSFVEAVGIGAFAEMVSRDNSGDERSPPDVALRAIRDYLVRHLLKSKPVRVAASIDGTEVEGEYALLECLNLPMLGPRLRLAPDESPSAPTVTVFGVKAEDRKAAADEVARGDFDPRPFLLGRGSCIALSTNAGAHVDGSPWPRKAPGGGRVRISAGAQSMRIWI